jgi:hypothetical protein
MSIYKMIGHTGWVFLIGVIYSILIVGTLQAAPGPGWEPAQLQKLTEGCVSKAKAQAQQDAQVKASRKNVTLGAPFSSNLQRLGGKLQSTCNCLTNKVSARWASLEQLLQVPSNQFDTFVKSQLQTGKCKLPDLSK